MKLYTVPIKSKQDEPGTDPAKAFNLLEFLDLLRVEEDYYPGEETYTKLMITRLRKIFYDQWGWNKYLIRGAKSVKGRYITTVVGAPTEFSTEVRRFKRGHPVPKHRVVTYSAHDRVYGDTRVGETPPILKNNYQSVRLPDDDFCHVAHILGVLDAYNHPQIASPLPTFLLFLAKLFPHCDSNVGLVSWLDDLGQVESEIINQYRRTKQPLNDADYQKCVYGGATGADMLADIDGYVIAKHYDIGAADGQRVTDILRDYYTSEDPLAYRHKRCTTYCGMVGLTGWDGKKFSNEKDWLRFNYTQMRDASTFQIFSETAQKIWSVWVPILVWLNFYKKILKIDVMLESFLYALKNEVIKESKNSN